MGLYTKFIAGCVFPIQERVKHHTTVSARKALEASQWLKSVALEEMQLRRLRGLLAHAEMHVPYYRERFGQLDFKSEDVRALSDLQKLPFLTKALIRANTDALKSENAQGLARFNTGGSSGEPLTFYIGSERVSHDVAAKWRATRWWDVDIGDPEIVLWGSPIELGAQDRVRLLRDRLMRTRLLPAFEMSENKLEQFVTEIRTTRPRMLFGYPSALARIASYAKNKGVRMNDLNIRVAFVTAERLYPEQRGIIETVFGCKVANGYGGRDAGFIAHECPHGGMHITAEDIIVETIDAQGRSTPPGVAGEIAVTHLATKDFPFIRYRTGDVGVLDQSLCACGRGLPLLKEIQGRTTDFVVASDGTVMHGLALIYVLRELEEIEAFKIVQESIDYTRVLVVARAGFDAATEEAIVRGLRKRLGEMVRITVEKVQELPSERSGKMRYVQSHVASVPVA
ncbi:MAG TPA: phenylacetate--CoA ligase family protein [Burkholderiales bacterium]|nr:phenylacetate--CoA ligase family protein [Burkholderiales bacterium]